MTQQTKSICITFVQCWANVFDVGLTLYKCYTDVLCLLGGHVSHSHEDDPFVELDRMSLEQLSNQEARVRVLISSPGPSILKATDPALRHVIGRDRHLDQSHAGDRGEGALMIPRQVVP